MKKRNIIRSYGVIRGTAVDQFTREGLAEVHLVSTSSHLVSIEETISDVPYRKGESDLTIICRAVMKAEFEWDFPWWNFKGRQKMRDFKQYNKWGLRH